MGTWWWAILSRSCFCQMIFVWFYDPLNLKTKVILDCSSYVEKVNAVLTWATCPCGQLELWDFHPEDFDVVWQYWVGRGFIAFNIILRCDICISTASWQFFSFPTPSLYIVLSLIQAVPVPKYLPNNFILLWLGFDPQGAIFLLNELWYEKYGKFHI